MITISITLLLIGSLFYFLAYQSPKTDLFLYFFAGMFILSAGLAGFAGYGPIQTGEIVTYTYTIFNGSGVIDTETLTPIYDNSVLNNGLSLFFVIMSFYLFAILTIGKND